MKRWSDDCACFQHFSVIYQTLLPLTSGRISPPSDLTGTRSSRIFLLNDRYQKIFVNEDRHALCGKAAPTAGYLWKTFGQVFQWMRLARLPSLMFKRTMVQYRPSCVLHGASLELPWTSVHVRNCESQAHFTSILMIFFLPSSQDPPLLSASKRAKGVIWTLADHVPCSNGSPRTLVPL